MISPIHQNFAKEHTLQRRNNVSFGTKIDPSLKSFVEQSIRHGKLDHDVVDLLSKIEKDGQPGNLFVKNSKIVLKVNGLPLSFEEYFNDSCPAVKKVLKKIKDFQDIDIVDDGICAKGVKLYEMVEKPSIMNTDGRYSFNRRAFYYALNPKRIKNIQEDAKKLLDEYIIASFEELNM